MRNQEHCLNSLDLFIPNHSDPLLGCGGLLSSALWLPWGCPVFPGPWSRRLPLVLLQRVVISSEQNMEARSAEGPKQQELDRSVALQETLWGELDSERPPKSLTDRLAEINKDPWTEMRTEQTQVAYTHVGLCSPPSEAHKACRKNSLCTPN